MVSVGRWANREAAPGLAFRISSSMSRFSGGAKHFRTRSQHALRSAKKLIAVERDVRGKEIRELTKTGAFLELAHVLLYSLTNNDS
jgi:hypothetical protein